MKEIALVLQLIIIGLWIYPWGHLITPERPINALSTFGFAEARVRDKDIWFTTFKGCGAGDSVKYTFSALNPVQKQVEVSVCCGFLLKSCTLRTR